MTINRTLENGRETKIVYTVKKKDAGPTIDLDRCFKLECVSKEEFDEFVNNWPEKLTQDWFMDWYSYNDFSFGPWPYSVVAMQSDGAYDEPITYKIAREAATQKEQQK